MHDNFKLGEYYVRRLRPRCNFTRHWSTCTVTAPRSVGLIQETPCRGAEQAMVLWFPSRLLVHYCQLGILAIRNRIEPINCWRERIGTFSISLLTNMKTVDFTSLTAPDELLLTCAVSYWGMHIINKYEALSLCHCTVQHHQLLCLFQCTQEFAISFNLALDRYQYG